MRVAICAVVMLLAASAVAQIHYKSRDGKIELKATKGSISFPIKTFTLSGEVLVRSDDQGLRIQTTGTVKGEIANSRVQSLDINGGVHAIKSAGTRRTEIKGRNATYRVAGGEGRLALSGPITITDTDTSSKSSFTASGTEGTAVLDADDQGEPLRRATLSGNVRVSMSQPPQPGQTGLSTFRATGDRMVLDNVSSPATVTLTGNIVMEGTGNDPLEGDITGVKRAVLVLDEKGQLARIDLSSEDGPPTTTTIRGLGRRSGAGG